MFFLTNFRELKSLIVLLINSLLDNLSILSFLLYVISQHNTVNLEKGFLIKEFDQIFY